MADSCYDNAEAGLPIISVNDLRKLMESGSSNLKIFDVTQGGKDAYDSCHIPGAAYWNIHHKAESTELIIRAMPSAKDFQEHMRELGVSGSSDVVVYDKADMGGGYFSSGRAWVLFRIHGHNKVRILDGGLARWQAANFETTAEVSSSPVAGDFTATLDSSLLKTFEDVVENLESKTYEVVDTRTPQAYGQGHIANAINLPLGALIDPETKSFKSKDDLKAAFDAAGVDLGKPLLASCTGGMTSCPFIVASEILGHSKIPLYVGSWTEWGKRASGDQIHKS